MAYNNICLIRDFQDPDGKNWVVGKIPTNDHCNTACFPQRCVMTLWPDSIKLSCQVCDKLFFLLTVISGFAVNDRRHSIDSWNQLCVNNVESEPLGHVFKPDLESLRSESDWSEMVVRLCLTMIL